MPVSARTKEKKGAVDMTTGSPARLLAAFALPLLAGNILQQLYNMVDSFVVGNYVGATALAAVGTGFPIVYLLASLFIGFSMGATVMIAQYVGAGDLDRVKDTVDTLYSAFAVLILPLTVVGVLVCGPLLRLIQVPGDVYPEALVYCMVVFAGVIGTLGYNINTGIMQGLGDSRTPLIFLAVACVLNIVLDLLFVLVFHWGVFGVSLATIIAQACSWVFGIFYINRRYPMIHIKFFQHKIDRDLLRQVLRLGIPSAVQQCQFSVAMLIMQALVNGFGTNVTAGFAVGNKIDAFAFMPIQSFATAVTTYVGQNMGAGRLDRVRRGMWTALALCMGVSVMTTALILPLRRPLLMIFNQDPAVVAAGEAYLIRVVPCIFVLAVFNNLASVLRGAGSTVVPMVASVIAMWAARVPMAYLLAYFFGAENLYWSYGIGWAIGLVICLVVYLRGHWKERCIITPA